MIRDDEFFRVAFAVVACILLAYVIGYFACLIDMRKSQNAVVIIRRASPQREGDNATFTADLEGHGQPCED